MSEDHGAIQLQLPAYLAGDLPARERGRVEEHLAGCADCADLVTSWSSVVPALEEGGEELFGSHPAAESLREVAAGGGEPGLVEHVESCEACRVEVSAWRRAAFPRRRGRRASPAMALVAGLVLGAGLATLAWRLPGIPTGSRWEGGASLLALESPLRGQSLPHVTLAPGQPYVPVAVVLGPSTGREEPLRFSIDSAAGERVWSLSLSAAEVRVHREAAGAVSFLVPAAALRPGRFTLVVKGVDPVGRIPFEVRGGSP